MKASVKAAGGMSARGVPASSPRGYSEAGDAHGPGKEFDQQAGGYEAYPDSHMPAAHQMDSGYAGRSSYWANTQGAAY
jgi:hypothetical protein